MKIKIIHVATGVSTNATIEKKASRKLPSLHDGWRFDFAKLSKRTKNSFTFVLVTEETPEVIEGCLIFQLLDGEIPYGAFIEVAPHNKGADKKYDYVAGCLIAYGFKQSLSKCKESYSGQLYFDVLEEDREDERQLMQHYSARYGAVRIADSTTMFIHNEAGFALIKKYLGENQGDD